MLVQVVLTKITILCAPLDTKVIYVLYAKKTFNEIQNTDVQNVYKTKK